MRILSFAAAILLLPSTCLSAADDARTILENAIKAHGGQTKLAKLKSMTSKAKGTIYVDADIPFTQEIVWQWPDRLKSVVTLGADKPEAQVEAITGDEGWIGRDGKADPLSAVKRDELRTQTYLRRVLLLTPLLEDNIYKLSSLEKIRIHDQPAAGIRVQRPGERDVKLYFDTGTGRLAKIERRVLEEAGKKKLLLEEEFFSDYQDIEGVPTAMKQIWHRDGKKYLEITLSEIRYPNLLDASLFADPYPYTRRRDVIYGHKSGVALTMDVFTPRKDRNGAAVVALASGGWFSDQATIDSPYFRHFLDEPTKSGYTVFAVCHGSQPRFTIPEAIADVKRAVRFIRYHARDYSIDPRRIGVTGGSAGGHLSLMLGVASDGGDSHGMDAVERTSSRVQAVACFVPPTDFLNNGAKSVNAFAEDGVLANLKIRPAIDVREYDKHTKRLERLSAKEMEALYRRISPIEHVSADDPPTLIIHGEVDRLVPLQQAEAMVARLKKAGVPANLIVKKGADHIWGGMDKDMAAVVDWFDKYLNRR
jgi:acetyl esterase/lipase